MAKKILLGTLLFGLIGVLVFGAVNRTIAKSGTPIARGADAGSMYESSSQATPQAAQEGYGRAGQGRNAGDGVSGSGPGECSGRHDEGEERAAGQGGYGQGGGPGNGDGNGRQGGKGVGRGAGEEEHAPDSWITVEGSVLSAGAEALVVSGEGGEEVEIAGRAWRYAQEMGYTFREGERLRLVGFNEDGEFKVVQIVRLENGETVNFREQNGRPYWVGRGRGGNQ